jgi:hypothetical protein
MESIEIIAQAIGIVAMVFNILSYQGKKQKTVITLQLFGGLLFAVNFWMIGAKVGGILNVIAVIRALVFLFKDKLKSDSIFWLIGFILSYIAVYVLTFTVFGTELTPWNLIREILPVIGMFSLTISYNMSGAKEIRRLGTISSVCWLIYNCAHLSFGGIACEGMCLASIIIGILRYDRKKELQEL